MELSAIRNLIREAKRKNETKLMLSSKGLTFLPSEVLELENLTQLSMSYNQLTTLPPEILELKNLTKLYLYNNQLTSLPPEISKLRNLTELYLSGNRLTSLPDEISELRYLTKLYIAENELISLPSGISELRHLEELDLSKNQLISLPVEISKLRNLTKLDVRNNQLTSLPPEILELELDINWKSVVSRGVFLEDNPFGNPPIEIIKNGREAITNYFKSLEDEEERLNEVKVLLVGEGGAGKTSLLKRLVKEGFNIDEVQTPGINIKKWVVKSGNQKIKVNFWDFGGQEIMHATHQFFLSKRSLYILVLDSRKDEKAEYWLKHIQSFGGSSPVLIAINKIDENPSFDLNRKFLKEKYPSIKGFIRISCRENWGIETFNDKLKKELSQVEHIQIKWSKSWFNVKTRLENMNRAFISYEEYERMCKEENVKGESTQNTLVDFLTDLGVVIHFKDIPLLDTHILEPKWITEAVYKIINSNRLAENKGILEFDLLSEILKQRSKKEYYYPPSKYNYIINLMKKFELCYEIDERTVLLPDLLQVQEPKFDFEYDSALKFFIQYDFLSKSVMHRFIVKMHKDIKNNLRWRTGVVLEDNEFNSTAVVKSDNEAKRIYIYVNGEQKRDYFSIILFNFREINKTFKKLDIVESVPMPNEPKIAVSYKHLIKLEKRGIDMYIPDGSDLEYNVKDLLGTISKNKSEEETVQEILKIVKKLADETDTEASLSDKLSKVISLNPNFMGLEVDVIGLVKLVKNTLNKKSDNSRAFA